MPSAVPRAPVTIARWVQFVKSAYEGKDAQLLHELLTTNVSLVFKRRPTPALRIEIQRDLRTRRVLESVIEKEMGDDWEWKGFTDMMVAYLWMVESANPNILSQSTPGWETEAKLYFERMRDFLNALNAAYSHPNGAILAYSAMMSAKRCIRVGAEIDRIDNDPKRKASQSLLNPLLRTFNLSLIGERMPYTVPGQMLKKAVAIDIGNTLFKLYNDLAETGLSRTVHGSLSNAGLPMQHPFYMNPTLCTYHYYSGLELMRDHSLLRASEALQSAYDICLPRFLHHRRKILIPLLACNVLIGKFPSLEILSRPEAAGLQDLFVPVCMAIRKGDFRAFRVALGIEGTDKWKREWWAKQGLNMLLEDRADILIWRSLIRKIWLLTCSPEQKQHIVRIDDVVACAAAFHRRQPEDIDYQKTPSATSDPTSWWYRGSGTRLTRNQVESIVLSLLDQKLIRGYAVRQPRDESTWLVLGKGSDPFPNVYQLLESRRPKDTGRPRIGGGGVIRINGVREIGA